MQIPPAEPSEIPRWLAIGVGVLTLPVGVLSALGGLAMMSDPPRNDRLLGYSIGLAVLWLAGVVSFWAVRLMLNRRTRSGGLLSVLALRAGGLLLLTLPFVGLFTGAYTDARFGGAHLLQALIYLSCGAGAFALASRRARARIQSSFRDEENGA